MRLLSGKSKWLYSILHVCPSQIAYWMRVTIHRYVIKKEMLLERKGCYKVISLSSYYLTILYLGYGLMTFGVMTYYIPLSYVYIFEVIL